LRFGLLAFAVVFLVVIPEGDLLLLPFFDLHLPKHSSSRPEQQTVSSSVAQWRNPCILLFALAIAFLVVIPEGDLLLLLSSPSPFSCHPSPQREDLPLSSRSGRVAYI
jgi:hypothetical protein